jgi:iron complex transport system permease protein
MAANISAPPTLSAGVVRAGGLVLALCVLIAVALLSLRLGSISISTSDVWSGLFAYDSGSYDQTVVRHLRLPRTVLAIGAGASLAIAGAVMQAVTRNPLAGPEILGVTSGAAFAVVTAIYVGGLTAVHEYMWFSFAGGVAAALLVFLIGTAGRGATPVKLALAGMIVSSLLASWVTAIILLDRETLDVARFWFAGSVAGRDLGIFWAVSPFLIGGSIACLLMGHQLNVLSLGEDTARSLGMQVIRVRAVCAVCVVLITGAAVSAAGPIAFVGLAVPHIVRSVSGPDHRWLLVYSALAGAILLTSADIAGRVVARPAEVEVGIVTAFLGAPVLIYLARRRSLGT